MDIKHIIAFLNEQGYVVRPKGASGKPCHWKRRLTSAERMRFYSARNRAAKNGETLDIVDWCEEHLDPEGGWK